jgi:hypothetical protein
MINKQRPLSAPTLILLAITITFSGCGGMFDKWADEHSYSFTDNFESIGAEMQIVMSMATTAARECGGTDPSDSTSVIPQLQVAMSPWELSAVRTPARDDAEPVIEKFKYAEMIFGRDSSVWNAGMRPGRNLGDMQMDFVTTGSMELGSRLGTQYYKTYWKRETTFPLLGKLLAKDSSVSIVTTPVRIGISISKPKPRLIDCGKYVGYFHAFRAKVVQDSIVKVEDVEALHDQ